MIQILNLFYEEPNHDRWVKFDRYPRKWIRELIRGKTRPGGVMMVALELMHGLDKLHIPYRFNDYKHAKNHPDELIGVIGKSHLIFKKKFKNPILFGAGVFSHPIDCPDLFEKYPNVKKMLVPGEWMQKMCEPYYGEKVEVWPVGIDTQKWSPNIKKTPIYDFLIYDKIRWEHEKLDQELITPIKNMLTNQQLSYTSIVYGKYSHPELMEKLAVCKAVIFLCEHETQGLAYQQILATGTPILAYEQKDFWVDPEYFPNRVKYGPVSAVPYWDDSCGLKFGGSHDFELALNLFLEKLSRQTFASQQYIENNLSLEKCALKYVDIYTNLAKILNKID